MTNRRQKRQQRHLPRVGDVEILRCVVHDLLDRAVDSLEDPQDSTKAVCCRGTTGGVA